jgi:subtilase family serine protease
MRGLAHSWRLWLTRPAAILFMLLNFAGGAAFVPAISTAVGHMTPSVGVSPHFKVAHKTAQSGSSSPLFNCQIPANGFPCYGPQQIRAAYNIQSLLNAGITGKHRTIVIIDAFGNPYIQSDLSTFDSTFGLPDPTLNIIYPDGQTPFDINNADMVGWSGEISLDVEWAHAVAPDATIDLVLSKSDQDSDIYSATKFVVDHNLGDVISQSFGEGETCASTSTLNNAQFLKQQDQLFKQAKDEGITVLASSGDNGDAQPDCNGDGGFFISVSSPASDPFVTAVGGTNLTADLSTGAYQSEQAWGDGFGESGGGFSTVYKSPGYQEHVPGITATRGVPDVSYNAGVFGGVLTHWGVGNIVDAGLSPTDPTIFFIFGGTSAGSPQWAGITALADQAAGRRLGFLNNAIYSIGKSHDGYAQSFHDITVGNNDEFGTGVYFTSTGWDAVTGWGTPKVDRLVTLLIQRIEGGSQG